jgi:hypothetical protein
MIIGQTIAAEDSTGTTVYTPWMPRQGENCTSTVDVIAIAGAAQVTVVLEHKNSDEPGAGTANGTTTVTTSPQVKSFLNSSACEELVRYKITVNRASGTGLIYAHLRMLAPSWESSGAQGV